MRAEVGVRGSEGNRFIHKDVSGRSANCQNNTNFPSNFPIIITRSTGEHLDSFNFSSFFVAETEFLLILISDLWSNFRLSD